MPPAATNLLQRLWNAFQRKPTTYNDAAISGSQYPLAVGNTAYRRYSLEIPDVVIRPVNGSLSTAQSLAEMKTWSRVIRDALSILSRDCFQRQDGSVASWNVAEVLEDGSKVHPDVLAIANELQNRYSGKSLLFGGNALQKAAREMMWAGDSYVSLGFEKEGIGRNDWAITEKLYLPPLTVFSEEDDHGKIAGYWQRRSMHPSPDDIYIHPLKMLNFQYEEVGLYGQSVFLQSIEDWERLKSAAIDLQEASRALGASPWVHVMPSHADELYKQAYQRNHEGLLRDGLITNLYLMPGADLRKPAASSDALDPIINYWLQLHYRMIPAGLALWMFPGLGLESAAGKDIANQPALVYSRLIASIRSLIGEQIRWAIALEIVMKRGFDWFEQNGRFDVVWGDWLVTGMEGAGAPQPDEMAVSDRLVWQTANVLHEPDMTDLAEINYLRNEIEEILPKENGRKWNELKRSLQMLKEAEGNLLRNCYAQPSHTGAN